MIRINLLKPEKKKIGEPAVGPPEKVKERKPAPLSALIILLAVVAIVALYFSQNRAINQESSLLEKAQQEKKELEYVLLALEQLEEQKSLLERKITLINQLKARQEVPVTILDELSKNIPGWVWLTETSFSGQDIEILGRALSNNLIADYVFNLENSPHISNVKIVSIAQRKEQTSQFLEFSLTAQYTFPPGLGSPEEVQQGGGQ